MSNKTKQWLFSQGMFIKDKDAARKFMLEASKELLGTGEINPVLRKTLGEILQECAKGKDNKIAGELLLMDFGLTKKIGNRKLNKLIQAKKMGSTNEQLAYSFNIGKNEIPKVLESLKNRGNLK